VDGAPTGIDVPRWSLSQPITVIAVLLDELTDALAT
jgi:hypothetical protein